MPLRTKNAAFLLKIQSVEGTYDAPSESTDGILIEQPRISLNPQNVQTNEVNGSLDPETPIVGGMQIALSIPFYLKGCGVPGIAPEFGDALRICGWQEILTKTDISGTGIAAVASGAHFTDSGNGLAALTVGTVIHASGFALAANNGEFLVATSAAGDITVTKIDGSAAGLVNESAGATITLRRGIAGVAATAGAASQFTAQAPWAATLNLYRGMPTMVSGNPATPAVAFIREYSAGRVADLVDVFGSPLDTNSKVSIPANALYVPATASIPLGSIAVYMDGLRWKFKDCRGTFVQEWMAAGAIRGTLNLTGVYEGKDDAAVPAVTYDSTRPGTFRNGKFLIDGARAAISSLSLDQGGQLPYPPDPNESEGFGAPVHVGRRLAGRMDPNATLIATRDIMAKFRAGTMQHIHARALGGPAVNVGQRLGLTIPQAFYEAHNPGDRQGIATEEDGFFASGRDSGAYLCIY
jgi:hypothetical protein